MVANPLTDTTQDLILPQSSDACRREAVLRRVQCADIWLRLLATGGSVAPQRKEPQTFGRPGDVGETTRQGVRGRKGALSINRRVVLSLISLSLKPLSGLSRGELAIVIASFAAALARHAR